MTVLEQWVLGVQCVLRTLRESGRMCVWRPWGPAFGVFAALLALLVLAAHPLVSWAMAPLVRALAGDRALRYPGVFLELPGLLGRCAIGVDALVLPLATGVTTLLFADVFRGARPEASLAWERSRGRWLALIALGLPACLAALGVQWLLAQLPAIRLSDASRALVPPLGVLAIFLVRAACFWLAPALLLERRSVPQVFAAIPGTFARGFLPAASALGLLALAQWPFRVLLERSSLAVDRGAPELVAFACLLWVALHLAVACLGAGAATLLHLAALAPERQDA